MSYQKTRNSKLLSLNSSFRANHHIQSPLKIGKQNPNYSFSEHNSFLNNSQNLNQTTVYDQKKLAKLPKYKPSTSLAEENLVRNFNKFQKQENQELPTTEPQRIELPLFFNTPLRITNQQKKENNPPKTQFIDKAANNIDSSVFVRSQRRLRDYGMLAFACRRAGKDRDEARAYYSMGVLNDNIGKLKEGIVNYKKFLQVCKTVGDVHGEALAYNCIGVNNQILAQNSNDVKLFQEAIGFHIKHEQLADINGKFLASINLGLCYDFLGDWKNAQNYYQNALRFSVKMANQVGQTIAFGNLGRIAMKGTGNNEEKMKVFIEKYLQLSSELKDKNGEIKGLLKMGNISIKNGEYSQGKEVFEKALQIAQNSEGNKQISKAKCGFAIAEVENQIQKCYNDYQKEISTLSPNKIQNY